jgi:hypothetical protein
MPSKSPPDKTGRSRSVIVRDMLVFQFKLVLDGVLDLILLPASLVAGLMSLIGTGPKSGSEFYDFMRLGRQGERWINLFAAVERKQPPALAEKESTDLDDLVSRVEAFVVNDYRNSGVTAQTKQRLDAALESLHNFSKQRNRRGPG